MELIEAIRSRRAVRSYRPDPVDEAVLSKLIDAAVQAPSAVNRQPWSFCVIRNPPILTRISTAAKAQLLAHPPEGAGVAGVAAMLRDPDFHLFYHAPALILISAVADDPWGRIDCALAAQNLMLAACDAGLGSCWVGFAEHWLAAKPGKALLGLSDTEIPIAPIIVGHPAEPAPPVPRLPARIRWI